MDWQDKLFYYNLAIDYIQHTQDHEVWCMFVRNKDFGIQFRRCDAVKILKVLTNEEYIESLGKTEQELQEFIRMYGPSVLESLIYNGSVVVASSSKNDYASKTFKNVVGITKLKLDGKVDKENMFTYVLYVNKNKEENQ